MSGLIQAVTSGDEQRAEKTASALASLGVPWVGGLERLLKSEDPDLRWWGLRVLAGMQDPPLESLTRALEDPSAEVRQCAALALCGHPHADSIPALLATLADPDPLAAELAGRALVAIGREATPALLEALASGPQGARIEAARALAAIRDPRAIPAFMKILETDSAMLHYWAEAGLEKLGLGMVYLKPE